MLALNSLTPDPFSRREKGASNLLSPFGREVGSEGLEGRFVRTNGLSAISRMVGRALDVSLRPGAEPTVSSSLTTQPECWMHRPPKRSRRASGTDGARATNAGS